MLNTLSESGLKRYKRVSLRNIEQLIRDSNKWYEKPAVIAFLKKINLNDVLNSDNTEKIKSELTLELIKHKKASEFTDQEIEHILRVNPKLLKNFQGFTLKQMAKIAKLYKNIKV